MATGNRPAPMTPYQVAKLMLSSTSLDDWDDKAWIVKQAHGGKYPAFWHYLVMRKGGVLARAQWRWVYYHGDECAEALTPAPPSSGAFLMPRYV